VEFPKGRIKEDTTMGDLILERPNKVSLGHRRKVPFTLMSDGKDKTTLVPPLAGYTVEPAPPDLSGLLTGVSETLPISNSRSWRRCSRETRISSLPSRRPQSVMKGEELSTA
jgi:hypothetical protein